jgi:2-polyprenyl-3-methyl-5-hydroxy-6-metoxy-1,4-benzoquinol methylase
MVHKVGFRQGDPMNKIIIKPKRKPEIYHVEDGTHSFILRDSVEIGKVASLLGREIEEILFKVFHRPLAGEERTYNYVWGKRLANEEFNSNLGEATIIQNLAAFEGLAPRVFAVAELVWEGEVYPVQIVENIGNHENVESDYEKRQLLYTEISRLCARYNVTPPFGDLNTPGNVINGKWVDWQGCRLLPLYITGLKKRVEKGGVFGDHFYQTVDALGIQGLRDTNKRPKELGFGDIDWKGKRVLDVGCSSGMFCFYAADHGAARIVGTDHGHVVQATRELANYLGYWNIDFYGCDLNYKQDFGKFDIVLFLSMYRHIRMPQWVLDSVTDLLVLEINTPDGVSVEAALYDINRKKEFVIRRQLPNNTDFHNRQIWHLKTQ